MVIASAPAQAPLVQDGAASLRQARLDWASGQPPLGPSSMPSFEVGWGGASSEGPYAPLIGAEGLGTGTQGWGIGLQGRYERDGWSIATTFLVLRDRSHTMGILQRGALAYRTESGWRAALEWAPAAWGAGLNGGDLLGDGARPFPRLSLSTPDLATPLGRWQVEAFAGRLEENPNIPPWITDREARLAAQSAGLGLHHPTLWGGILRGAIGPFVEASLGTLTLRGGQDDQGHPAPTDCPRTQSLAELRVRLPALAQGVHARGAALLLSRSAAPDSADRTLKPARDLGGLQLVWDRWDLGLEYAGVARATLPGSFAQPSYLAGFSSHGDSLGADFGPGTIARTVDLGLPLILEGQGRLKLLRATSVGNPATPGSVWQLQVDAQWRTPIGRIGTSLASRRDDASTTARWGWTFSAFQAIRVF